MKYALVGGVRQEATPKLLGACIGCGSPMIAKCGTVKLHHWAHKGRLECDHWWEPETEWHRAWKNQFPSEWQEVRHRAESGEIHIADVKTPNGAVLEFQYSAIHPDEVLSRETFYGPTMAWIASGTRLKRDAEAFRKALLTAFPRSGSQLRAWWMLRIVAPSIIQRWADSSRRIFLDLGDVDFSSLGLPSAGLLWQLDFDAVRVSVTPVLKSGIIKHYSDGGQIVGFESHDAETARKLAAIHARRRFGRRPRF